MLRLPSFNIRSLDFFLKKLSKCIQKLFLFESSRRDEHKYANETYFGFSFKRYSKLNLELEEKDMGGGMDGTGISDKSCQKHAWMDPSIK